LIIKKRVDNIPISFYKKKKNWITTRVVAAA
jgi:hypothetical protein